MRTLFNIVLVVVLILVGCVSRPSAPDITPPPIHHSLSSGVLPPPNTNAIVLHFTYPVWPLTNGYLESSTDLLHWVLRDDFTNDAAGDWHMTNSGVAPSQFFRAAGETIP